MTNQQGKSLVEYAMIIALILLAGLASISLTGIRGKCTIAWVTYQVALATGSIKRLPHVFIDVNGDGVENIHDAAWYGVNCINR